jgi:hypothetical protein
MQRRQFEGATKAYSTFGRSMWRIRQLVDLGTVGIDQQLEKEIDPLVAKFADVKGIRGRKPKDHEPVVKQAPAADGKISMSVDARSAFLIKVGLKTLRKAHDELRYFHYANLAVAIWAAFETYHSTLFEQIYRDQPDLLKSSEQISVKDAVAHKDSVLDFLIERQLEVIGHYKLADMLDYYRKRTGIETTSVRVKRLEGYYFLRNVIAHKTGLVRPAQRVKASVDFRVVGDQIRVSKAFLLEMAAFIDASVRQLEAQVKKKFYPNGAGHANSGARKEPEVFVTLRHGRARRILAPLHSE